MSAVISQQIQQHQGHLAVCPPKTAASARVIALDRTTVTALRAHRVGQRKERKQAGEGYRDSGYVFTRPSGDPLVPDRLSRTFRALIAEHGLPPIRLHDLRHGSATLALAAGVELKVVQDMLGYSSIVLTADTYTSVLPEVAHRAAEKDRRPRHEGAGCGPGHQPDPPPNTQSQETPPQYGDDIPVERFYGTSRAPARPPTALLKRRPGRQAVIAHLQSPRLPYLYCRDP